MAEGRARAEWSQTAAIMALLANCNRDPRRRARPYTPDDFMPEGLRVAGAKAAPGTVVVTRDNIGDMKAAFSGFSQTRRSKQ